MQGLYMQCSKRRGMKGLWNCKQVSVPAVHSKSMGAVKAMRRDKACLSNAQLQLQCIFLALVRYLLPICHLSQDDSKYLHLSLSKNLACISSILASSRIPWIQLYTQENGATSSHGLMALCDFLLQSHFTPCLVLPSPLSYVHLLSFSNVCSFLSYRFYKWCSLLLESFPYHFISSLAFQPLPPS